jgi:hypothetical protein
MTGASNYGPYDLLEDIDLNPPQDYARRVRRFMLDACSRLAERLPAVAASSLRVARDFSNGACDVVALEAARVACWNHLGGRSCDFRDRDVSAVRAVICTLFPDSDDAFDTIHNFLDLAVGAGLPESQLLESMRAHFDARAQGAITP